MKLLSNIIFILCFVHLVIGDTEITDAEKPNTEQTGTEQTGTEETDTEKTDTTEPEEYKLEQLQVLFRHGDRTPSLPEVLPNDPNEEVFRKIGYGQLTKLGKEREYKIGKLLRERYNDFLGEEFNNDEVFAYSSDLDRTKMSLQLVLAGLYPPTESTKWSDTILWQPIPTHSKPVDLCFLSTLNCPERERVFYENHEEPEFKELFQKYDALFRRVENSTGITISSLMTTALVFNNIGQTVSLGLPFPEWCSEEDYKMMEKFTAIVIRSMTHTELLRRMVAGPLIEQMVTALHDNTFRKLYLYGGHDVNIAAFINSQNITDVPELHDFGSSIIMEKLRAQDGKRYMRMFLWTGVTEKLLPIKLPNCDIICPVSEYEQIVKPILPTKQSRICHVKENVCDGIEEDLDLDFAYFYAGPDLKTFKYMHNFTSNSLNDE